MPGWLGSYAGDIRNASRLGLHFDIYPAYTICSQTLIGRLPHHHTDAADCVEEIFGQRVYFGIDTDVALPWSYLYPGTPYPAGRRQPKIALIKSLQHGTSARFQHAPEITRKGRYMSTHL